MVFSTTSPMSPHRQARGPDRGVKAVKNEYMLEALSMASMEEDGYDERRNPVKRIDSEYSNNTESTASNSSFEEEEEDETLHSDDLPVVAAAVVAKGKDEDERITKNHRSFAKTAKAKITRFASASPAHVEEIIEIPNLSTYTDMERYRYWYSKEETMIMAKHLDKGTIQKLEIGDTKRCRSLAAKKRSIAKMTIQNNGIEEEDEDDDMTMTTTGGAEETCCSSIMDSTICGDFDDPTRPLLKEKSPPLTTRKLQFGEKVKVRTIPLFSTYSEEEWENCWYTPQEKMMYAKKRDKIVARMESGKPERSSRPYRGLEYWTNEGSWTVKAVINMMITTVMDEQDLQWTRGVDDYERIANFSQIVSEDSVAKALWDAKQDEIDARKIYQADAEAAEKHVAHNNRQLSTWKSALERRRKASSPTIASNSHKGGTTSVSSSRRNKRSGVKVTNHRSLRGEEQGSGGGGIPGFRSPVLASTSRKVAGSAHVV